MSNSICPWWLGYSLINPLRGFIHNPEKILKRYISPGKNVMDIGSGMGYFTLPMAGLLSGSGRVLAVDMQEEMLRALKKRAAKANVHNNIEARNCTQNSLQVSDLRESIDFVLAFAVVHEVPDKDRLFSEIYQALKPGGLVLFAEPKGHVKEPAFQQSLLVAANACLTVIERPEIYKCMAAVLKK